MPSLGSSGSRLCLLVICSPRSSVPVQDLNPCRQTNDSGPRCRAPPYPTIKLHPTRLAELRLCTAWYGSRSAAAVRGSICSADGSICNSSTELRPAPSPELRQHRRPTGPRSAASRGARGITTRDAVETEWLRSLDFVGRSCPEYRGNIPLPMMFYTSIPRS